jgi:hypothetical protein
MIFFVSNPKVRTPTDNDEIFSGYQPCQLVKNYRCFGVHLCLHSQRLILHKIEDVWEHGLRIIVEQKKDYKTRRRTRFYYEKLFNLYPSQNIIMATKSRVQILYFWTLSMVLLLFKTPSYLYFKTQIEISSIVWAQLIRFYMKTEIESCLRNVVFWNINKTVF